MISTPRIVTALVASAALLTWGPGASAGIKCWTNKEGFKECGNVVPPEYAQQGHTELSKQGLIVNEQERAKTAEELAAEAAERERVARAKSEADRAARAQAARDRVLLDTFTAEEDLLLARDGKAEAFDARIQHTRNVVAKLDDNLRNLEEQAAKAELGGRSVPEKLREDIGRVKRQIKENRGFIAIREKEKMELMARFDEDLDRYRELKSR